MTRTRTPGSTIVSPARYVFDALTGTLQRSEIVTLPTNIQAQIAAAKAVFLGANYIDGDGWLRKGVIPTVVSLLDVSEGRARSIAAELSKQGLIEGNGSKGAKRRTKIVLPKDLAAALNDAQGAMGAAPAAGPSHKQHNPVPSLDDLRGNKQGGGTITIGVVDAAFGTPVAKPRQVNGLARQLAHIVADQVVLSTSGDPDLVAAVVRDLAERGFPV